MGIQENMKLSIIIPCFNEAGTIEAVINEVQKVPFNELEVIVVDDGSFDGTRELLTKLERQFRPWLKVIFQPRNKGKGAAVRSGFHAASGDICIIQDADLEYNPQEITAVITPILEGKADVVFGSRFQGGQPHRVVYFWHRMGNAFLTLLSNIFTDLNLTDMEVCYKAFRYDVIKEIRLQEDRFGFEPEITAKVARQRCRIYEVGISYHGRTYEEGKKIGWRDGVHAIWCIMKYNLFTK